jgi:hypothetical protein
MDGLALRVGGLSVVECVVRPHARDLPHQAQVPVLERTLAVLRTRPVEQ